MQYHLMQLSMLKSQQLDLLDAALNGKQLILMKQNGLGFYEDHARSHTPNIVPPKIEELGWGEMADPPFPEFAPSKWHYFRSLQNRLDALTLEINAEVETELSVFYASKPKQLISKEFKSRSTCVADTHRN